ncbi:MAG: hypothetical protein ACYDBJ_17610 [Aggregatilineales bacterium]
MAARKVEPAQQQQIHEMLVRLLTIAELLVSPPENEPTMEHYDDERTKQEAVRAALQKTQALQVDV